MNSNHTETGGCTMKTRTIAGRKFTLETGACYIATGTLARHGSEGEKFEVTIRKNRRGLLTAPVDVTVSGLGYKERNRLLNAFNNGATSFDGRVW